MTFTFDVGDWVVIDRELDRGEIVGGDQKLAMEQAGKLGQVKHISTLTGRRWVVATDSKPSKGRAYYPTSVLKPAFQKGELYRVRPVDLSSVFLTPQLWWGNIGECRGYRRSATTVGLYTPSNLLKSIPPGEEVEILPTTCFFKPEHLERYYPDMASWSTATETIEEYKKRVLTAILKYRNGQNRVDVCENGLRTFLMDELDIIWETPKDYSFTVDALTETERDEVYKYLSDKFSSIRVIWEEA